MTNIGKEWKVRKRTDIGLKGQGRKSTYRKGMKVKKTDKNRIKEEGRGVRGRISDREERWGGLEEIKAKKEEGTAGVEQ